MSSEQHFSTIDEVMHQMQQQMNLSRETEHELLSEIRGHLEDAVETAVLNGEDPHQALQDVAARFGVNEVGHALQKVHAPYESADAVLACIIPVVGALILRWLVFSPDGSAIGWEAILSRPAFWVVAVVALVVPILQFPKWRYAAVSWALFWIISVIFFVLPHSVNW
ncbi:MAG: hypothetical protein AAF490_10400 [Chloroflexota bacterium]